VPEDASDAVLNTKHPILTRLVRPKGGLCVFAGSHRENSSTMSATCVNAKSLSLSVLVIGR
jgi:hypothetical protein